MKPNYELAYMKMDKFMDGASDLDRFYGNKDVNDLADFINSNIVDEDRFYSYAGKGATVEGFAQYLIDNSLNESIEEFYNVANGAESILEDFADDEEEIEEEPIEAEVEIDFEETPGYFSGAFDELDKIYDEENSDQEEANEDEEEIEAIDVLTDKLDAHGDEDTVTIAEKGQLDNPDAPKLEIEVNEEEGEALANEFCDGEKDFGTEENAETEEDSEDEVEESLNEAKKEEDELPPDPEAVKLEVHNNLNNLVASEISTIDEYENAKSEIIDAPIEHKDELINTIDHIKDEEKEHIDELINATSEIPFAKTTSDTPVAEPTVEPDVEESLGEDIDNEDNFDIDDVYDGIHALIQDGELIDLDQEVIDEAANKIWQDFCEEGNTKEIYELINEYFFGDSDYDDLAAIEAEKEEADPYVHESLNEDFYADDFSNAAEATYCAQELVYKLVGDDIMKDVKKLENWGAKNLDNIESLALSDLIADVLTAANYHEEAEDYVVNKIDISLAHAISDDSKTKIDNMINSCTTRAKQLNLLFAAINSLSLEGYIDESLADRLVI